MLTATNRDDLYILTPFRGDPRTDLKLRGTVTQTSVIDVLLNQSALAIHHITDN